MNMNTKYPFVKMNIVDMTLKNGNSHDFQLLQLASIFRENSI